MSVSDKPGVDILEAGADRTAERYVAPGCTVASGDGHGVLFEPDLSEMWLAKGLLEEGAVLEWGSDHEEQALYLESGELQLGDLRCGPGGVLLVPEGSACGARVTRRASVVHFGSRRRGPRGGNAEPQVVRSDAVVPRRGPAEDPWMVQRFSEGLTDEFQLVAFTVESEAPHIETSHSHDADEIIYVLEGELQVGRHRLEAGSAIAIPADYRYGFRTHKPWKYFNARPGPSTSTKAPSSDA